MFVKLTTSIGDTEIDVQSGTEKYYKQLFMPKKTTTAKTAKTATTKPATTKTTTASTNKDKSKSPATSTPADPVIGSQLRRRTSSIKGA